MIQLADAVEADIERQRHQQAGRSGRSQSLSSQHYDERESHRKWKQRTQDNGNVRGTFG